MTRRFFGCLSLAAGLLTAPLFGAEPGSGSPNGTVHLPSGVAVHYDYHYDRNALRDARRADDTIIALTESGNLLRLDLTTLKLTREWFGPVPVSRSSWGLRRHGRLDPSHPPSSLATHHPSPTTRHPTGVPELLDIRMNADLLGSLVAV